MQLVDFEIASVLQCSQAPKEISFFPITIVRHAKDIQPKLTYFFLKHMTTRLQPLDQGVNKIWSATIAVEF